MLLVSFGIFYYTTDYFKDKTNTLKSVVGTSRQVVIDGVNLRLRYAPSSDAETYKWADGTNRHPEKGERFPYLGEVGDFYAEIAAATPCGSPSGLTFAEKSSASRPNSAR